MTITIRWSPIRFGWGKNFYNTSTLQPNGNVLISTTADGLRSLYFTFYSLPVSNANFRIVSGSPAADTEVSILANMNGQVYQCSNSGVGYAAITVSDTGRIDISIVNTWMLHVAIIYRQPSAFRGYLRIGLLAVETGNRQLCHFGHCTAINACLYNSGISG